MRLGWSSVRAQANKWHLVGFYSSVITMMHGPTIIKFVVSSGYEYLSVKV